MKLKHLLISTFPVWMFTASCNKFLDVKPKTQIDGNDVFKDEQGYIDALTGVYLNLNADKLYGKELTFGFVEVIGKQHTTITATSQEYYYPSIYDYLNTASRSKTDGIYGGMYNAIAEDNNIISHLNADGPTKFTGVNYRVIRGEAYALRALMHFDLLRLFGPSPVATDAATVKAIPYFEQLTVSAPARLTTADVLKKVISDLSSAEADLQDIDPVSPASTTPSTNSGFLRSRGLKMNYYAVKALQARVYLYAGDKEKALAAARSVINSKVYTFAPKSTVTAGNRLFSQELIFSIPKSDMTTVITNYFTPPAIGAGIGNVLTKSDAEYSQVYESSTDIRYSQLTGYDANTRIRYSTKLSQTTETARIPMFRMSELYYIAAECLMDSNPQDALNYLSAVRVARDVPALSNTLTPAQIRTEIFKEYQKELYCEGQLFYYYKRLNSATINGATVGKAQYVLPLPDDETEYGNGGN
ncbi:RagB/SusD family nutrient uptake outer membrane protein [Filimonas effusa]|uniref:RagB/SusD family nutrient uptake outer membrane protein n=1 Tax=Filimonas effusa TaxID=2508721 RepID=A0A4V1MA17_9BACT|nr:RagB/SusD family nutrient uptake outer membrane protein [Filimonas effusa]RXK83614.1 RagB/SusD family nutrient uptake outer membrane protein [Filimonas effusa]